MIRFSVQKVIVGLLTTAVTLVFITSGACKKELNDAEQNNRMAVPDLSQNYAYGSGSADQIVTLGRVLFYDTKLSLNNATSCGSCHKQQHGFADNQPFSRGLMGKLSSRNTSSLINPQLFGSSHFFWDGRSVLLQEAVLLPVLNQDEMHAIDLQHLPEKLAQFDYYPALFQNAFGSPEITVPRIREALTLFLTTLTSRDSRVLSLGLGRLTSEEYQGEQLFKGKAKCYSCHVGQDFSGYDGSVFFNIGLETDYTDKGRYTVTGKQNDKGAFKMPSLRNVAESAPYMHDGRFATLREVIDHYDHGVKNNPQLSFRLRDIPQHLIENDLLTFSVDETQYNTYPPQSLNLTETEKQQLEAYLRAMSDPVLLNHPKFSDPFRRQ